MTTPLRLLLVRHGQTEWNVARRVLGRTDIPLDATGIEQAARLARALPPLGALYASPLRRALQTARAVAEPEVDPDLTEMDQGELDGLGPKDLLERHGALLEAWRDDPDGYRLPGGETLGEVRERGLAALRRIASRHGPGEVVGVVTHQLLLAACLSAMAGEPLRRWRAYTHRNTAWAVVDYGPGPTIVALDQAPHLLGG